MLLLIDAGNTRIKWALVAADSAAGGWLASGAVAHAQIDTLAAQWAQLAIHEALLSNVAGAVIGTRLACPSSSPIAAPPPPSTPSRPTAFSSAG